MKDKNFDLTEQKEITKKVIETIKPLEVVLPTHYSLVFMEEAEKLGYEFDLDNDKFNEIDDIFFKHLETLNKETKSAINAIKNKDEKELELALSRTEELQKEIETLKSHVYEDALTKVYNRKWLQDNYLANEKLFIKNGYVTMIDLNDFKIINDTLGHIVGDKVLLFLSQQFKKTGGEVIRYGGDEFFIFFSAKTYNIEQVKNIIHNTREIILKKTLQSDNKSFKTSFAYGVSEFKINDKFEDVIAVVDKLLYEDKIKIKERLNRI